MVPYVRLMLTNLIKFIKMYKAMKEKIEALEKEIISLESDKLRIKLAIFLLGETYMEKMIDIGYHPLENIKIFVMRNALKRINDKIQECVVKKEELLEY